LNWEALLVNSVAISALVTEGQTGDRPHRLCVSLADAGQLALGLGLSQQQQQLSSSTRLARTRHLLLTLRGVHGFDQEVTGVAVQQRQCHKELLRLTTLSKQNNLHEWAPYKCSALNVTMQRCEKQTLDGGVDLAENSAGACQAGGNDLAVFGSRSMSLWSISSTPAAVTLALERQDWVLRLGRLSLVAFGPAMMDSRKKKDERADRQGLNNVEARRRSNEGAEQALLVRALIKKPVNLKTVAVSRLCSASAQKATSLMVNGDLPGDLLQQLQTRVRERSAGMPAGV
jgi:hypothetical protein